MRVNEGRTRCDPDAIEVCMELAGIRKARRDLIRLRAERRRLIAELQNRWQELTGMDWAPKEAFLQRQLTMHSPAILARAIEAVAPKVATGYVERVGWPPYLVATMRRMEEENG